VASLPLGGAARADSRQDVLAPGTRFATPILRAEADRSGPTVLVVAGIHGNEAAGPVAARELASLRLERGRLLVVPEANRPALAARSRYTPGSRHGDLNRDFPTRQRGLPRGEMAHALCATSESMGSSVVVCPEPSVRSEVEPMAARVLTAVNASIARPEAKFTRIQPGPDGSFARAMVEQRAIPALVLETTWTQPLELRVAQHRLMIRCALEALGVARRAW
jgi:predicted deacylase